MCRFERVSLNVLLMFQSIGSVLPPTTNLP